jgi:cell volume regulation protein A
VEGERLPRWARPALVVREGRRLDVHSAGRLRPDDYVYIFTTPRQVGRLDRLFASQTAIRRDDPDLFGEFVVPASAPLAELSRTYGFEPTARDRERRVGEVLTREFGDALAIGDRLAYGPIELIVRTLGDDGRIETVGIALEPVRLVKPQIRLPWAPWRHIKARRERGGATPSGPPEPAALPPVTRIEAARSNTEAAAIHGDPDLPARKHVLADEANKA